MDNKINEIFENNIINDLDNIIKRQKQIKRLNVILIYLFHLIQSIGIFTTMIATKYNKTEYIILGVGFTIFASLINIYEKINSNISDQLLQDIIKIKNGNYIDNTKIIDNTNL